MRAERVGVNVSGVKQRAETRTFPLHLAPVRVESVRDLEGVRARRELVERQIQERDHVHHLHSLVTYLITYSTLTLHFISTFQVGLAR